MILGWLFLALLLLLDSTGVHAMGNHSDVLRDQYGRALGGATVSVYNSGTPDLAAIFSDNGVTGKANPFTTDNIDGSYNFYAANGVYDIVFSHPQATFDPLLTQRISIIDGSNLSVNTNAQGLDANFVIAPDIVHANLATPLTVGDGVDKWRMGRDATIGLFNECVISGVPNACNYVRQLSSGFYWEIKAANGTPIIRVDNNTQATTYLTVDAEAAGNNIQLPFRWDLDLCGVNPTDSSLSHVWNKDPLSTAPTLTAKVGTNRGTCVATFPDVDGDYGVQITRQVPDGVFTGNFDADIWWDTTGTGNARFQIQTKCYSDDTADDAAFLSASIVTAAAGTSGRPNKQTITNITKTGCNGGDLMRIRIFRNRTEASDTLNAALNLEKVVFKGRVIE